MAEHSSRLANSPWLIPKRRRRATMRDAHSGTPGCPFLVATVHLTFRYHDRGRTGSLVTESEVEIFLGRCPFLVRMLAPYGRVDATFLRQVPKGGEAGRDPVGRQLACSGVLAEIYRLEFAGRQGQTRTQDDKIISNGYAQNLGLKKLIFACRGVELRVSQVPARQVCFLLDCPPLRKRQDQRVPPPGGYWAPRDSLILTPPGSPAGSIPTIRR
jgi:hypothetical protein